MSKGMMGMRVSVIIPSFNRVQSLKLCLEGLMRQCRLPDEIIVVVRNSDDATMTFIASQIDCRIRMVTVDVVGVIAALNTGLQHVSGDILVITDDDTIAYPDWIEKIAEHFQSNERLGGLGGKDDVYHSGRLETGQRSRVGQLLWFGRMIGNHHIGYGRARQADILKGANMSFRRKAIEGILFDENLKGTGAQVHLEVPFCLAVKNRGWELIYDPGVGVNHFPAERFDEDKRNTFNETAFFNMAHNETYSLLKNLNSAKRFIFLLWAFLIGSKATPGFIQWIRFIPQDKSMGLKKLLISFKGRVEGWRTWKLYRNSN
ncbi:glycosyltransferase family 2 protein [Paenibacillus gorillae]|uniref:glycosyltransferase family 2 protein n=1 Tax=Paenibacillus gorillae TaxID=1243662 RepID=UPI001EE1828E|nr:glycosyltransferase family 2 protein [Paenibacillus gorillae]